MHAFDFRPEKPSGLLLRGSACKVDYTLELSAPPYQTNAEDCTSGLPAMNVCCWPSAGQKCALLAKNDALPPTNEPLPATGALSHHTATEHKQRKMEGFPRICLYYAPHYHLKTSKECHSWIQNHQSSISNA